jgi:hypothetical protein
VGATTSALVVLLLMIPTCSQPGCLRTRQVVRPKVLFRTLPYSISSPSPTSTPR